MHAYRRRPHFYETDQMGVIHHANYIRWMEEARVAYMDEMGYGYNRVEEEGISIAVTGITGEYRSMVRFGDLVDIQCAITACSAVRMRIVYRITDAKTGALRFMGESRHCYVNREGRPVSLKKALPELFVKLTSLVETPEEE